VLLFDSTGELDLSSPATLDPTRDLIRVPDHRPGGGSVDHDGSLALLPSVPTPDSRAPADQLAGARAGAATISVTRIRRGRRPDWRPAFLENVRSSGNVSLAAAAAGVDRSTAYAAASHDPAFAADWAMAADEAVDGLEAEARRRALAGSDQLLMFLLRGLRPERYRRETPDIRREIEREAQRIADQLGIALEVVRERMEQHARELDR
jgi:hypothetical protein